MPKWEFLRNMSGTNGTQISIMDLPLLLCKHRGMGNPLIQTGKHPCTCRHPFTCPVLK